MVLPGAARLWSGHRHDPLIMPRSRRRFASIYADNGPIYAGNTAVFLPSGRATLSFFLLLPFPEALLKVCGGGYSVCAGAVLLRVHSEGAGQV
eukprot:788958-Rhodomonas_salina.4